MGFTLNASIVKIWIFAHLERMKFSLNFSMGFSLDDDKIHGEKMGFSTNFQVGCFHGEKMEFSIM